MPDPISFFLGIGAQKCGTTWLARYLDDHPEVGLPPFKEVHFWTSKYTRYLRGARTDPRRTPFVEWPALARQMRERPARALPLLTSYGGLFAGRVRSYRRYLELCGKDARICGEITPAYSTLPPEAWHAIEAALSRPRYILLLRNPADRYVSQITHDGKKDSSVLSGDALRHLHSSAFALRSDYSTTLAILRELIPKDRLLVAFYEELFDPERGPAVCDGICDFLNVARHPPKLSRRVNARKVDPPPFDREPLVRALERQYRGVVQHLGQELPASWLDDLKVLDRAY